jgi:hypothetical protein
MTADPTPTDLVDRLRVGGPLLPTEVSFTDAQLRAYERAVGAPVGDVVPEPLLVAACITAFDRTFPRVPGTLHLGQELRVLTPLAAGDVISITGHVATGQASRRGWRFSLGFTGSRNRALCFDAIMFGQVLV